MITDVVLTIATVSFVWCLSFISVMFLILSDADYNTKNSYSIMVLYVIVFMLSIYCGYMFLGV